MNENEALNQSWNLWIDEKRKMISMREMPNSKKIVLSSEKELMDFASRIVFKGYKLG